MLFYVQQQSPDAVIFEPDGEAGCAFPNSGVKDEILNVNGGLEGALAYNSIDSSERAESIDGILTFAVKASFVGVIVGPVVAVELVGACEGFDNVLDL